MGFKIQFLSHISQISNGQNYRWSGIITLNLQANIPVNPCRQGE